MNFKNNHFGQNVRRGSVQLKKGHTMAISAVQQGKSHEQQKAIALMMVEEKLKAQRDLLVRMAEYFGGDKNKDQWTREELKTFIVKMVSNKENEIVELKRDKKEMQEVQQVPGGNTEQENIKN